MKKLSTLLLLALASIIASAQDNSFEYDPITDGMECTSITVGKKATEGIVEFKGRKDENNLELTIEEAIAKMKEICG